MGSDQVEAIIASDLPDATVVTGLEATVAAGKELVATTDRLHMACHGHHRADSPRFSSFMLTDGSFTLFARVSPLEGGELAGAALAFLAAGSAAVVAPVYPVRDTETTKAMAAFYRSIDLGPAAAIAGMDRLVADGPPELQATAASFQVIGSRTR